MMVGSRGCLVGLALSSCLLSATAEAYAAPSAEAQDRHPVTSASRMPGERAVTFASSKDGTQQPMWLYVPTNRPTAKLPLVVTLHSWSVDWNHSHPRSAFRGACERNGWALIQPNFRGPNETPQACGSDFAVQDIVDAVAWAKRALPIDESRIYLVGGSGGGHCSLLLAGRHPEIWAGVSAACPISDLARWHADSTSMKDWRGRYAKMMEKACGGTPAEKPDEYARRSPLTYLAAAKDVPVEICEGVHDGHAGSVPVGHAIRAFNALAKAEDRISEADIAFIEKNERAPEHLAFKGQDPFYGAKSFIHLRRTSGNVRLTLFEAGHAGNYPAAADFFMRQQKGRPADWTVPKTGASETTDVSK